MGSVSNRRQRKKNRQKESREWVRRAEMSHNNRRQSQGSGKREKKRKRQDRKSDVDKQALDEEAIKHL